ncbi:MAG TPA: hypothetical protein VE089_10660 [Nitrososphaeraceae archaeon]|jgi:hypothetical protein|nr:hypothetical protein [Nitrososphaeraceae archaeon]
MNAKSVNIEKRDMFITYAETLDWILYVIQSIKEKGLHFNLIDKQLNIMVNQVKDEKERQK